MKLKLFLLAIMAIISTCSTAQDKPSVIQQMDTSMAEIKSIPDTARLTVSRVYNDIKDGLKGLGSALKVGSEHVYVIIVKQQIVKSVIGLILIVICFIIIFPLIKFIKYLVNHDDVDEVFGLAVACVFLCIGWIILVTFSICNIGNIVTGFINPEYGAIKDIMSFINPKNCN